MGVTQLKARRLAAAIPGNLLCGRAGISRTRLSDIERGYVSPSPGELQRLKQALDELIDAKSQVCDLAARVGWPMP